MVTPEDITSRLKSAKDELTELYSNSISTYEERVDFANWFGLRARIADGVYYDLVVVHREGNPKRSLLYLSADLPATKTVQDLVKQISSFAEMHTILINSRQREGAYFCEFGGVPEFKIRLKQINEMPDFEAVFIEYKKDLSTLFSHTAK